MDKEEEEEEERKKCELDPCSRGEKKKEEVERGKGGERRGKERGKAAKDDVFYEWKQEERQRQEGKREGWEQPLIRLTAATTFFISCTWSAEEGTKLEGAELNVKLRRKRGCEEVER